MLFYYKSNITFVFDKDAIIRKQINYIANLDFFHS